MGEIKSTLDLVMEKTRNLTLSDEEKQAQKHKETKNRIKGLMQKLQDGLLTKIQLVKEYEILKKDAGVSGDNLLVDEVFTRLDPDRDNEILLAVLEECCDLNPALFRAALNDHREACDQAARIRSEQLKARLAQKHSIGGSAVVPNLDVDDEWRSETEDLQRRLKNRLNQLRSELISGPE